MTGGIAFGTKLSLAFCMHNECRCSNCISNGNLLTPKVLSWNYLPLHTSTCLRFDAGQKVLENSLPAEDLETPASEDDNEANSGQNVGKMLPQLAAWLKSGPAISLAVFSFEAAALSSTAATAQAVSVSVDRISLHLGAVKSASRPGSVTAALLALRDVPVPRRGFRASLGGIELGVATSWVPQPFREESQPSEGIKVHNSLKLRAMKHRDVCRLLTLKLPK